MIKGIIIFIYIYIGSMISLLLFECSLWLYRETVALQYGYHYPFELLGCEKPYLYFTPILNTIITIQWWTQYNKLCRTIKQTIDEMVNEDSS